MTQWQKVKIGEFLEESRVESTTPNPENRIKVRLNVKGVEKRQIKNSIQGATKYYVRKSGQFIYGKQNLFKGAFGVIPVGLDGFETSADLPCFDVDKTICLPEWLVYFLKQGEYYRKLEKIARGAGSRRISPKDFFKIQLPLPLIQDQKDILTKIKSNETIGDSLRTEITYQQTLLKKLRQAILQETTEGKLTKQWRKENSDVEPSSILLEKINAEKNKLIEEKKIKKAKPLPPIEKNEIPFEIPESWEWCRLGEMLESLQYGTSKKCFYTQKSNTPILRIPNVSTGQITINDLKYTNLNNEEKNQYSLKNEDLLVIRSNGSRELVGRSVFVSENFTIYGYAGYLIRLRLFNNYLSVFYIHKYFNSPYLRDQIEKPLRTTVGINNINSTEISNLIIPFPPLTEQKEIVKKVDYLFAICDELEGQINNSKANADILMQAVLKEAFEH